MSIHKNALQAFCNTVNNHTKQQIPVHICITARPAHRETECFPARHAKIEMQEFSVCLSVRL